jgi:hypothetical protein
MSASSILSWGCVSGTLVCALRTSSASETSRCWVPSCRSRSMRRRMSSVAATMRARDAVRSARAWVLAMAVPTRSVKSASLSSMPEGSGLSALENALIAPQSRPSTVIGAPTAERMPRSRAIAATDPRASSKPSMRAGLPLLRTRDPMLRPSSAILVPAGTNIGSPQLATMVAVPSAS